MQAARRGMFPPRRTRAPQTRSRGKRKPQFFFRPPDHLRDHIEDVEQAGYTRTEVIVKMLDFAKDAADELGADWYALEHRAAVDGTTPGTLAGQILKQSLKKRG